MINKQDKSKLVLLSIDGFGVEENTASDLNMYKFISLENWKKLINFKNSSKIIEYKSKEWTYQNELFTSLGIKNNLNSDTFVDFTSQFEEIYKAIKEKISNELINNIHIFININNDFINFYLPLFNNFLSQFNLFLFENKFKETDHNFFRLNLIIEKSINNIEHFDQKINVLLNNNFNNLINSITIKNGFTDELYLKDETEIYFEKVVLQKQNTTFYSIKDFLYEDFIQKESEDVIITNDSFYNKINNQDLILYFNFDFNSLNSFSKTFNNLFIKHNINIINLSLLFKLEQIIPKDSSNEISKLINKDEHNVVVIGKQNISFLNKIIFGSNKLDYIKDLTFDNSYKYIYDNAALFFDKIEENIQNNNIIFANWNILTEVKKYFGFYEWLYALLVFDLYIYKIVKLLDKNKIRWSIFSTSFGFEKSFILRENESITVPYLSNQFYSNIKGYSHANWDDLKISLIHNIKNTNKLSLATRKVEKVTLNKYLLKQQEKLSLINSKEEILEYIKEIMPKINTKIYDEYINKMINLDFTNDKFKFDRISWDQIVDTSKKRINIHNMFASMYIEEKEIFNDKFTDSNKSLYKLVMFYYQNDKFLNLFEDYKIINTKFSKITKDSNNSLKNANLASLTTSFNAYFDHILNVQKSIEESQNDDTTNLLDLQYFKDEFNKVQIKLKEIKLIKLNKFSENQFKYISYLKTKNKNDELLLERFKTWENLFNKFSEQENIEYQESFNIAEGIQSKISKEDFTEIIDLNTELIIEEDDF